MATNKSGWEWKENNFEAVAAALTNNVRAAVEETAYDIVEAAQNLAPVDTGALRASIHPVFMGSSGYAAAVASARALGKEKVRDKIGGPIGVLPQNKGGIAAAADVAVTYGSFLEYGAFNVRANRWMKAQPFLTPALESCRSKFERRLQKALCLKIARAPKAQISDAGRATKQQASYERYMSKGAAKEARDGKSAVWDNIRGATPGSGLHRVAYGVNRTRTGKQMRETLGEMWERLRNDYEHRRNFD